MKWQLCPKCLGEANVPTSGMSSSGFETCPVCNGKRLIPEYQPESTEGEDARREQDELWGELKNEFENIIYGVGVRIHSVPNAITEFLKSRYTITRKP